MTRTEALQVGGKRIWRTVFVTSEGTMIEIITSNPPSVVRELSGDEAAREIERERSDRSDA